MSEEEYVLIENGVKYIEVDWSDDDEAPPQEHKELAIAIQAALQQPKPPEPAPKAEPKKPPAKRQRVVRTF